MLATWLELETRSGGEVGLHVLRHSAAYRMSQAGASPKAVQTILGHRSAAFTLSVYGHLFDADLDEVAARLDSCSPDVAPTLTGLAGRNG
jgi:integrase